MNKEIDYVVSITTAAQLDADGRWVLSGGLPQTPDEAVVRQITFSSNAATNDVYLIGSDIGFIGSVVSHDGFVACPQTRLQLRNPLSQSITFNLYMPNLAKAADWDGDIIAVTLDFIKYKK